MFYTPLDDFTNQMLTSIPRKTLEWLTRLKQNVNKKPFKREGLLVTVNAQGGSIRIPADHYMIEDTQIRWVFETDGTIGRLEVNDPTLTNVTENLDHFIRTEKKVYDVLNALQQKRMFKGSRKVATEMRKRGVSDEFIRHYERGIQASEAAAVRSREG